MKKGGKRYWYIDENGLAISLVCHDDSEVKPNYIRGMRPLPETSIESKRTKMRLFHKGKPKPLDQRIKMRDSKIGVKKSNEHKSNMSNAHKHRCIRVKIVAKTLNIDFFTAGGEESRWRKLAFENDFNLVGPLTTEYINTLKEHVEMKVCQFK